MPKPQPRTARSSGGGASRPRTEHSSIGEPLAPTSQRVLDVRTLIAGYEDRMQALLPRHLSPGRMLQLVMNEVARTPDLLSTDRNTLIGCVLQVAQLGLELGGVLGEAHLIPRYNRSRERLECTLIVGYRGLMKLARRSGEVAYVEAAAVREGDHFRWCKGLQPMLEHRAASPGERGETVTDAWALAVLTTTPEKPFEVFEREKIERARAFAAADSGPWTHHYDEMACKTVVRHLCKYLPSDTRLQTAVGLDERASIGLPQELDVTWDLHGPAEPAAGAGGDGRAPVPRAPARAD